jgi:hypothetical protein
LEKIPFQWPEIPNLKFTWQDIADVEYPEHLVLSATQQDNVLNNKWRHKKFGDDACIPVVENDRKIRTVMASYKVGRLMFLITFVCFFNLVVLEFFPYDVAVCCAAGRR